jgi:hypothetical protein
MLAPAFGEHVLLMRFKHGEATDLVEIARKASFIGKHWKRCSHILSSFGSLIPRGKPVTASSMADRRASLYTRFKLVRIEASGFKTW